MKNLIFDVGDVLISYRWKQMLIDFGLTPEEAERVGLMMFQSPDAYWTAFDLGEYTVDQLIEKYCQQSPKDREAIEWFIRHSEYMHVPRPKVWKLVHQLKEVGYGIYLLSNYSEPMFQKHTQYADFWEDVDGLMVSYMVHIVKPDPGIYQALLEKYQLNKEECLFFDDRLANCETARELGIKAFQVTSQEMLCEKLKSLL